MQGGKKRLQFVRLPTSLWRMLSSSTEIYHAIVSPAIKWSTCGLHNPISSMLWWMELLNSELIFFLYSVGGIGDRAGVACELRGSKSIRAGMSPHLTGYNVTKVKPKPGGNHNTQQILQQCGSQTEPAAHRFSCAKAQLRVSPPAQGKDTQNSPTATPTCSRCEPLGHVRIKTQARLSDQHREGSDLLWASSSGARVWLNSWEFVKPHSLGLLDSALCYKYFDFLHSLQAATLTSHFSLCAD